LPDRTYFADIKPGTNKKKAAVSSCGLFGFSDILTMYVSELSNLHHS
jgi:hypothetical protein